MPESAWLSLTIYCLLTPLGYKQTAVNTPPAPPKWRQSTYYFIYISIYPEGKKFPVGVGWGGLLLLLFLNNFCYSCMENLKGKGGVWGEAICCHVQSGNYSRPHPSAGCAHWYPTATGAAPAPYKAAPPNCPLHNCENKEMCLPPSSRAKQTKSYPILAVVSAILLCCLVKDKLVSLPFPPRPMSIH